MSPQDAVIAVVEALNTLKIPYMLVGSYSSNTWGHPRSTNDADLVLELQDRSINELMALLPEGITLESQMSFETITSTQRYRLFVDKGSFKIELFFITKDPFDQSRFSRRLSRPFDRTCAFVASAEDVVIQKLRWSKGGKRSKDIADAMSVLRVRLRAGGFDMEYVREWCTQHGTLELLDKLLDVIKTAPSPD